MQWPRACRILAWILPLAVASSAQAVQYRLTFTPLWTPALLDDPTMPPALPLHYTDLVGTAHDVGDPLWRPGGLASVAVERVAEDGNSADLFNEVRDRIARGEAESWIQTDTVEALAGSASSVTVFDASFAHSEISLVSMIAPSPDWFLGISGVSLLDASGAWIDHLSFDLRPWDAGTEEGNRFEMGNPASTPHGPIHELLDSPFLGRPVLARIELQRIGAIPEPGTGLLFALGLVALAQRRKG